MTPSQLDEVLRTNLLAPMLLTRRCCRTCCASRGRRSLFVGSALGRIGLPGFSVYGASKAGLHGFAEALRRELGDSSVRVQLLAPRSTRTAFNDAARRGLQPCHRHRHGLARGRGRRRCSA